MTVSKTSQDIDKNAEDTNGEESCDDHHDVLDSFYHQRDLIAFVVGELFRLFVNDEITVTTRHVLERRMESEW